MPEAASLQLLAHIVHACLLVGKHQHIAGVNEGGQLSLEPRHLGGVVGHHLQGGQDAAFT